MSLHRLLCPIFLLLALPLGATAQVEGVVSTSAGSPIEHVRVEIDGDSEVAFSGRLGDFRFPDAERPSVLRFSHPRFDSVVIEVTPEMVQPLAVTLKAKQEVFEEIAVTATPGEDNFSPVSVATSIIEPGARPFQTPPPLIQSVNSVPGGAVRLICSAISGRKRW